MKIFTTFLLGLLSIGINTQICTLTVPNKPLSVNGLSTPYELSNCNMADAGAFVQASIFDRETGEISVYSPLVINKGTVPLEKPVVPTLPKNRVVALWFGSNADTIILKNQLGIKEGRCVNGLKNSPFGQFAYCNAKEFFKEVLGSAKLRIPELGVASDGLPCPTTRDFMIVDMDPSDNLHTTYLLQGDQTAQNTGKNRDRNPDADILVNPSDERLLNIIAPLIGCDVWEANDLADPGAMVGSLALNELQGMFQLPPMALIPAGDPMVLVDNNLSLKKLNLYRVGVNQPIVNNLDEASTQDFCDNYITKGGSRLQQNKDLLWKADSLEPDTSSNLFNFMALRFSESFQELNCEQFGLVNPVELIVRNEIVVDANFVIN